MRLIKKFLIDLEEEKKLYVQFLGGASFVGLVYLTFVIGLSL